MKNIDHIAIQVNNIKESVDYYVENFGCEIIHQDDTWAFLQFGNIKMALVVEDEHPYHIAFEIDGMDGKGKNWKYHRDGSISRYIDDPSGNKVELIWYMDKKKEIKHFADGFHEGRWEEDMKDENVTYDIHGNKYDPTKMSDGQSDFTED